MEDGSCIAGWMAGYSLSLSLSLSLAQLRLMVPERRESGNSCFPSWSARSLTAARPPQIPSFSPVASSDSGPTFLPINLTLADCARGTDGYDVAAAASHFSLLKRESLGSSAFPFSHFNYWDIIGAEKLVSEEGAKPPGRPQWR